MEHSYHFRLPAVQVLKIPRNAKKSEKQEMLKVAVSRPIDIDLIKELNADKYSLAKTSTSHFRQLRFSVEESSVEQRENY